MTVELDTSSVEQALDVILARMMHVPSVVQSAAQQAQESITGIPVGATGDLKADFGVRVNGPMSADVINTALNDEGTPYGRFVFWGTRYMQAEPGRVGYTSQNLAEQLQREIFP